MESESCQSSVTSVICNLRKKIEPDSKNPTYIKHTADCTAHFIRTDLLTEEVIENLQKVTNYAAKHEAQFMKLLTEQTKDGSKRRNAAKKNEMI